MEVEDMAQRTATVLACDFCAGTVGTAHLEVEVDGRGVALDACPKCWRKFVPAWERLAYVAGGRREDHRRRG